MDHNDFLLVGFEDPIYLILRKDNNLVKEFGLFWPTGDTFSKILESGKLPLSYKRTEHVVLCVVDRKKWFLKKIEFGI